MQVLIVLLVFPLIFGFVSCNESANSSLLDSLKGVAEKTRDEMAVRLANLTDAVEHKWEIVHDIMDGDLNNETSQESEEFDEDGCDRKQLKHFEDRCDEVYERVNDEAQMIEDDGERKEAVCCSLEDFEKCSLRAYDQANCVTDKAAIRENLKAARLFLTVIANITCNEFRGQCAYYSSAITAGPSYTIVLLSYTLFQFYKFWSM